MKAIIQADLRDITDKYDREEISYSKMNKLINDKADDFAIGFAKWMQFHSELWIANTTKELLKIYKNEIQR